ncbi:MAG TPA: hypothetical protein VIJ27_12035 [Mucilaginibacter sp.]
MVIEIEKLPLNYLPFTALNNKMIFLLMQGHNTLWLCPKGKSAGKIKPEAYMAFVVTEKIKKRLKPKQRQQERNLLLLRACLSFVDSF